VSAKTLAFANQKGGVGKTTSCINVAASLAFLGYRVLLVDLDPQGNATMGSGIDKHAPAVTVNDVLQKQATLSEAVIRKTPAGFALLPANSDLTAAEVTLLNQENPAFILKTALEPELTHFDFIFFDCPPSLNMLTLNALTAAQAVLIPMQCEYYALEGLSDLMATISEIKKTLNPNLEIGGVLGTMYDARNRLAEEVLSQLRLHFGDKLYRTLIPRNVRLAEAPSHGLPALLYDASSKGAESYLALAREMVGQAPKVAEQRLSSRRQKRVDTVTA